MEQLEYSISLESLKLENFRCFSKLDIQFDEKLTVFIANNGGGKTAILDAIAEGLKGYLATLKIKNYEKSALLEKDIKQGDVISNISTGTTITYLVPKYEIEVKKTDVQIKESEKDSLTNEETFNISISDEGSRFKKNNTSFEQYYAKYFNTYFKDKNIHIPVLAYYGGDSVKIENKHQDKAKDREIVYKNALTPSRINYTAFKDWFEKRYTRYLNAKVDKPNLDMADIDPELSKIRSVVEIILNDDIDDKMYQNLRMDYRENSVEMVLGKQNDKKEYDYFEISQLSAGELSLFAFVADLGLRLLYATPLTKSNNQVGVIHGKGIVLIDEVDLHLHPLWQRKVMEKLMIIFPDIQFVMTTHSPVILNNIYSKHIRVIDKNGVYGVRDTFGHDDADDMLKIMGFNSEIKTKIKEIHRLLSRNKISEAKAIRREIITEGIFAPLLEIDLFIQRKEQIPTFLHSNNQSLENRNT